MKYLINDAKVSCPCIDSKDHRSWNSLSTTKYCTNCHLKRCQNCTLHSPILNLCLRCKREYSNNETYCYRCYTCPICDSDLITHPLSYKSTGKNNGIELYELIRNGNKGDKIVAKSVYFKCKDPKCNFRFNTNIETKPQTLQDIVMNNIKDEVDVTYEILKDYYDWLLNYHRILDKKQQRKWKSEILKRFQTFEIAEILKAENLKELNLKEIEIINEINNTPNVDKLFPIPKKLFKKMNDICLSCLEEIGPDLRTPLVYVVPMIGYLSSKVKELTYGELLNVPILISIINKSADEMSISLIGDNIELQEFKIGYDDTDDIKNVPTCLLSHIKDSNWKEELAKRNIDVFHKLEWNGENIIYDCVLDSGINWITTIAQIPIKGNVNSTNGKIKFNLTINNNDLNTIYQCNALI